MGAEEGRGVQGNPQVPGLGTRLGTGSILRWDKAEGTDVGRWMMMSSGVCRGHKKEGLEV